MQSAALEEDHFHHRFPFKRTCPLSNHQTERSLAEEWKLAEDVCLTMEIFPGIFSIPGSQPPFLLRWWFLLDDDKPFFLEHGGFCQPTYKKWWPKDFQGLSGFRLRVGVALFHQRITMALTVITEAEEVTQVIAAVKDTSDGTVVVWVPEGEKKHGVLFTFFFKRID